MLSTIRLLYLKFHIRFYDDPVKIAFGFGTCGTIAGVSCCFIAGCDHIKNAKDGKINNEAVLTVGGLMLLGGITGGIIGGTIGLLLKPIVIYGTIGSATYYSLKTAITYKLKE